MRLCWAPRRQLVVQADQALHASIDPDASVESLPLMQEPECQVAALEQMAPSEPQSCIGKPLTCLHSQEISEGLTP